MWSVTMFRRARKRYRAGPGSGGLVIQKDAPATREAFIEQAEALGMKVQKASRFGFRPEYDRSSPVPIDQAGAPIVAAARELRRRRRGEIALNGTVITGKAKSLLRKSRTARGLPTNDES